MIGQKIDLAVKEEKGKVLICNLGPTFAIWDSAFLFAIKINKTHTSLSKKGLAFSTFSILFEHFGLVWLIQSIWGADNKISHFEEKINTMLAPGQI